uniref:Transmembrane 9 superfamily member n=1 Tax=Trypanosoma vivax (strain Y486) TaxID=1055687 RepID=G0TTY4_TRYVY|nr:putative endosomal integral membrane protein [Trypanosoma vivax Y486]
MSSSSLFCRVSVILLFALLCNVQLTSFAVLSGMSSHIGYNENDQIQITVKSLTSMSKLLPYDFYWAKTCMPEPKQMEEQKIREGLGEVLLGNRMLPSLYSVNVLSNITCMPICIATYREDDISRLKNLVRYKYRGHMFLAGLPLVETLENSTPSQVLRLGYRLGALIPGGEGKLSINNHLHFRITYAQLPTGVYTITGFYVTPYSLNSPTGCPPDGSSVEEWPTPAEVGDTYVPYSYSVSWEKDHEGIFVTRWDVYARTKGIARKKTHLIAVYNSVFLLSILSFLVMVVLLRTVRRDLLDQTELHLSEDLNEELGWKLVRRDVFRTPPCALLLTAFISTGFQVILMVLVTVLLVGMGALHVSHRGSLLTCLIISFCLSSSISGFVAGKMLKFFRIPSWKNGFSAVTLVPGLLLGCYLFTDAITGIKHATTGLSLSTLLTVLTLWTAIPAPLAFVGLLTGFRSAVIEAPVEVGSVPRNIPERSLKRRRLYVLGGGAITFIAGFVELSYFLAAVWKGEPFYFYGYLLAILFIITIICAELSVVVTYVMLSDEDYQWWWGSFCTAGCCGLYLLGYSAIYLFTALEIRQLFSVVLFFAYTFEIAVLVSVYTGTIGFIASTILVKTIYGAIKAD